MQSEGRPLRYLYRVFGTAVLRAVPKSLLSAQLDKAKADIERDVIGTKMDGETVFKQLPAEGTHAIVFVCVCGWDGGLRLNTSAHLQACPRKSSFRHSNATHALTVLVGIRER
jgi:hypothetical protein